MDDILPEVEEGGRVGIAGGSYSPPHIGHYTMITEVQLQTDLNQIWILPAGDHPEKEGQTPFHHRMEMCDLAFSDLKGCKVVPIEQHLPSPNYTADTLQSILEHRPEVNLHFIMGSDLVPEFPAWERADEISEYSDFIITPREGHPIEDVPEDIDEFSVIEYDPDLPEISSTKIRCILRNNEEVNGFLDKEVKDYIEEEGLYV